MFAILKELQIKFPYIFLHTHKNFLRIHSGFKVHAHVKAIKHCFNCLTEMSPHLHSNQQCVKVHAPSYSYSNTGCYLLTSLIGHKEHWNLVVGETGRTSWLFHLYMWHCTSYSSLGTSVCSCVKCGWKRYVRTELLGGSVHLSKVQRTEPGAQWALRHR